MSTSIPDKDIRKLVEKFPVKVSRSKKHLRIHHAQTGRFVIAPISGSDWRGIKNLERDLRRLCASTEANQKSSIPMICH